ncbi:MAG: dihydroorotate dehydrogenase-like protein [Gemmataceae bacterium]
MNLATTYMGFELPHPVIPGSSPLADNLDAVKRLEDAGAPLIILRSLFEEQLAPEGINVELADGATAAGVIETPSYLPEPREYALQPEEYLELLRKTKAAVSVPVLGSLNGISEWGWLRFARLMEEAGADGLELNLYEVATEPDLTGQELELQQLEVVRAVKETIKIPVAVKLSPFYASIPNFARQLDESGADALVLFNRFFEPDVDVERRELAPVNLSSPSDLSLRLRWTGILAGKVNASLAVTGGVSTAADVVKAVLVGAHATQMVSALLRNGPAYLAQVRLDLERWLEEHQVECLRDIQGTLSLMRCEEAAPYQRANYIRLLQGWRPSRA